MAITMRRAIVVSLLFVAVRLHAQAPCDWTPQPGQIVEDCGIVGVGILAPWGGLHVKGSGQTTTSPQLTFATQAQNGSTLFLQDSGGAVGNGGMVAFGAAQGHFAAIKGHIGDGSGNTTGTMLFLTRNTTSDTVLTERMRIFGSGHVSIGSTSDTARLRVAESAPNAWAFNAALNAAITTNSNLSGLGAVISADHFVNSGVTNSGGVIGMHLQGTNTGPGTLTQTVGQVVYSGSTSGGPVTAAYGSIISLLGTSVATGYGVFVGDVQATTGYSFYQVGANDVNYYAGKVGIGTTTPGYPLHVVGNVRVDGTLTGTNIQAQYQDVAEWVPSGEDLAPGTVVVLDPAIENTVVKSTRAYDTTVAGVVSAQPGIILGVGGAEKEQIATTGRVRVRVDATSAPIRIGDLLVTGDKPGSAMKSKPIDVGGSAIHRPGTIIGKALEALPSGEGEILVLLSLQ